jgi:hypothetical protein
MQKEPGRIVDNHLNRPVKETCDQRMGNYGHLCGVGRSALGIFRVPKPHAYEQGLSVQDRQAMQQNAPRRSKKYLPGLLR